MMGIFGFIIVSLKKKECSSISGTWVCNGSSIAFFIHTSSTPGPDLTVVAHMSSPQQEDGVINEAITLAGLPYDL